jgi:hypothetical protein
MFESTLPIGASELMRVSDFRRYLQASQPADGDGATPSRLSALNPSLLLDLLRFERDGHGGELLNVVAASLRHGKALLIHLGLDSHVIPLTLFPTDRMAHCPLTTEQLLSSRLNALEVLQVEPALLTPPDNGAPILASEAALYTPLSILTWELALRGARDTLLPELAGPAAYRVTPGTDLKALNLGGTIAAAIERLRRDTSNLNDIAQWPGFDRERAMRLLNALYLQVALMISHTHPAASTDNWVGSAR